MPFVAYAACVASEGGIGGTGMPLTVNAIANDGGIGGTGALAEGGIGGTGIVGTITGFASVCIDGLEVNYDKSTQVSSNGEVSGIHELAIGQVIAIDSINAKNGLLARKIDILNAVEGPVTGIRTGAGLVEVMGQKIRLNDATQYGGVDNRQGIIVGMSLKVSGYRNSANEIVASRIDVSHDKSITSIIGMVAQDSTGQLVVSGLSVQTGKSTLVPGSEVLLRGTWDGRQFHTESAKRDPSLQFAGHVNQVVVEGLVIDRTGEHQFKISGFDIDYSNMKSLAGGKAENLTPGRLVRVVGRLQSGRHLRADHIEIMQRHDAMPMQKENGGMLQRNMMSQPMPTMRPNSPMPMMRH